MTLTYKEESITFDMPGWYSDQSEEGVHTGSDMKVSDRILNRLKARSEGLLEPEEVRRIRRLFSGATITQVLKSEFFSSYAALTHLNFSDRARDTQAPIIPLSPNEAA